MNMCKALQDMIDVGVAEGVAEGLAAAETKAKLENSREMVLELLEEFGVVPNKVKEKIMSEEDMDTLKKWHKLAAKCENLEEFEKMM